MPTNHTVPPPGNPDCPCAVRIFPIGVSTEKAAGVRFSDRRRLAGHPEHSRTDQNHSGPSSSIPVQIRDQKLFVPLLFAHMQPPFGGSLSIVINGCIFASY